MITDCSGGKDIPVIRYPDPVAASLANTTLSMNRGIYLMESFWRDKTLKLEVPLADCNSYNLHGLDELREATIELHNAVSPIHGTELTQRELVFGMGATQCFHAALYAYRTLSNSNLSVTTELPGYLEYRNLIDILHPGSSWIDIDEVTNKDSTVEIICSPNNPDGRLVTKRTDAKYVIHDNVNFWPFFFDKPEDYYEENYSDQQISIYSYSKILGFSASRVGYAFVKDKRVADLMRRYIVYNCHGMCTEGQLKCLKAVQYILQSPSQYVETLTYLCQERWRMFIEAVDEFNRNNALKLNLLNNSGPTAWISLDIPAVDWANSMNILATYGPEYGASDNHLRINILSMPNEFHEFLSRLKSCI
jgi:aspartate/methionine/tyrosine aminotransferase